MGVSRPPLPPGPDVSVVVCMYNEAEVIGRCVDAIRQAITGTAHTFEVVCVDDGSSDGCGDTVLRIGLEDARVRLVTLSRNFGKEAAMSAGLDAARGACVVFIDADLQHPPEVIPKMLAAWQAGADIVDGVKAHRGREGFAYRLFAETFYWLMGSAVGSSLRDSSDFKLLDRAVADAIRAMPERTRFLRGLVAWVGFRRETVSFQVQPRAAGQTRWSSFGLFRYSLNNLVSFSSFPLRVVAWVGAVIILGGAMLALRALYQWFSGTAIDGFTTVIVLQTVLSGVTLLSIGVIAVYIAQMYDELKGRPVYVVRAAERPAREERVASPAVEP
jgi:glycosyltransferase involved in cell wall biosynthesis